MKCTLVVPLRLWRTSHRPLAGRLSSPAPLTKRASQKIVAVAHRAGVTAECACITEPWPYCPLFAAKMALVSLLPMLAHVSLPPSLPPSLSLSLSHECLLPTPHAAGDARLMRFVKRVGNDSCSRISPVQVQKEREVGEEERALAMLSVTGGSREQQAEV